MKRLGILAFLLLLAASLLAAQDVPEIARSLMEEAERAREAKRYDEAIDKYTRAIEAAPTLASAYVNLGTIYFEQGKIDEAYQTFVRGVERAPSDRTLLSNAAAAAQQTGRSDDALKYVDQAIERNRRDAALHTLRATILRSLNRGDEALRSLQQAVTLAPNDARVHFSLGNLLYQLGKKPEAVQAYQKATSLDRSMLRAYYNLGAVLFDLGRDDEALKAYKVALDPIDQTFARGENVEPIHAQAYANLGAILLRQKQWPAAEEAYRKALRLDPKSAAAHYNLGFVYFQTQKFDRAEEAYTAALALEPALPLAHLHLGEIAFRRGDHAAAVALLKQGLPQADVDAKRSGLRTLARAELALGNRGGARAALEEALALQRSDAESLHLLGRILRQEKRYADAAPLLEEARRLAPQSRPILFERVLLARESGNLAAERTLLEELLRSGAGEAAPALRSELALVLVKLNAVAEARREIESLLATTAPANSRATEALRTVRALLLAREGKVADAQKALAALPPSFASAALEAIAGRRENAARTLDQLIPATAAPSTAIARGNLGLLLWQLGRHSEAKPHLQAARAAIPEWREVALAAGEIALIDRDYDRATELLGAASRCDAATGGPPPLSGDYFDISIGPEGPLCARAKSSLALALLAAAAAETEQAVERNADTRQARHLLDRATALPLDDRHDAIALLLRGTLELARGSGDAARETFNRALSRGLTGAAADAARSNLAQAAESLRPETPVVDEPEPTSATPRRTVLVLLPDAPAENEKRLLEAVSAMIEQVSARAGIPLDSEFFRRADDARAFFRANRERVGMVMSNLEIVHDLSPELKPRYQFVRDGSANYRRVVVVRSGTNIASLADLRTRSISMSDALRQGVPDQDFGRVVHVPDDLTSLANVLFGKSDAALVSDANPLLAQHLGKDVRVIWTSGSVPLPVVAFAPMPDADRRALDGALSRATASALQVSLARIGGGQQRVEPQRIEIATVSAASLSIKPPDAPAAVPLRVVVELPRVEISEDLIR